MRVRDFISLVVEVCWERTCIGGGGGITCLSKTSAWLVISIHSNLIQQLMLIDCVY